MSLLQLKNIEDDPTITPGSVTPSPLLTSMTKASSSISSDLPSLSLASSTWSYTPQQHSADAIKNGKGGSNATWSDGSSSSMASELWTSINPPKQGGSVGPPGLGAISGGGGGASSKLVASSSGGSISWGGLGRSAWPGDQRPSQGNSNSALPSQGGWPTQLPPSTWLILKNLTPQVRPLVALLPLLLYSRLPFVAFLLLRGVASDKWNIKLLFASPLLILI